MKCVNIRMHGSTIKIINAQQAKEPSNFSVNFIQSPNKCASVGEWTVLIPNY